jgi:hypothetical protein
MSEYLQPRNSSPCGSCIAGVFSCAERVPAGVRPLSTGKKRAEAPVEHGGVGESSTYVWITELTSGTA